MFKNIIIVLAVVFMTATVALAEYPYGLPKRYQDVYGGAPEYVLDDRGVPMPTPDHLKHIVKFETRLIGSLDGDGTVSGLILAWSNSYLDEQRLSYNGYIIKELDTTEARLKNMIKELEKRAKELNEAIIELESKIKYVD